ncbi:MAG: nicotinate-nicotinamide nucleotide adenylyltransferase [Candidatus Melainabacteria bacterium]|jgi:nicotinate-nucleotide adenylyltransferase|nr:nicotinate-nicotinamide nucleotide adenylyltransferase [Candidatus Melainabacteria bacterium]
MNKIGLLGGSFDPVHKAHIEIAQDAMTKLGLDEVHFILTKEAPHKTTVLSPEKRFELLSIALQDQAGLIPSRIELDRAGVSYSYLTVEDYKKQFPDTELFWILGEDAFAGLEQWQNYDYLAKNLEFMVFPRIAISSSEIRTKISNKEAVDALLPEAIRQLAAEYYSKA